eukprot:CAMPEP_0170274142 /NCGR_PEP_ID=MMETSP0116_2-20130129/37041_1 /TAXON_ID=400756 /ORGANISM="Durinskia baltica, Strain CSIRO CS-38" /LENGTH=188 /DNA_ID=CAMNT_0010525385 /DNA_START=175 /DNA_END=741 /DNA_ORIENTATION=+
MATATCTVQTRTALVEQISQTTRRRSRWHSATVPSRTGTVYLDSAGSSASLATSRSYSADAAADAAALEWDEGEVAAETPEQLVGQAGGALPDSTTMNMVHCLFALAFAALTLGSLTLLGVVARSNGPTCPPSTGYSGCAVWQDFRSILSFVLGALLCCVFTRGKDIGASPFSPPDGVEKVQLYAYML